MFLKESDIKERKEGGHLECMEKGGVGGKKTIERFIQGVLFDFEKGKCLL